LTEDFRADRMRSRQLVRTHSDGPPQKLEHVTKSTILLGRDGMTLKNEWIELNHPTTTQKKAARVSPRRLVPTESASRQTRNPLSAD